MSNPINGVLVIDKPKDFTSRDIINILNKKFNIKKIGHTGTLDPLATGVLVVCLGKYTKLVDKITSYDKEYIATIKLGMKTDSLDVTGRILEKNDNIVVDKQEVINILNSFVGKSIQEVPIYSAVKINGKRLYEYARDKQEITLPKREINISEIELLKNVSGQIVFRVVVSKGTYIRSLIQDICKKLHVLGTMSDLKRTRQGKFTIKQAISLEKIEKDEYNMLDIQDIFDYPIYFLSEEEYFKVKNGVSLYLEKDDLFLMLKYANTIVAIYKNNKHIYKPYLMLL